MAEIPLWIKIGSGIIAIASTLIGLTVYFTKLKIQGTREFRDLQSDLETKHSIINDLESSVQALTQSLDLLRKGKEDSLNHFNELDNILSLARNSTGATADSILILNPFKKDELVFLTVHGEAANKIKQMKIPVKDSLAGTVFQTRKVSIFPPKDTSEVKHFERTDQKSGFHSDYILSIPLITDNIVVGVLQLLNKRQGTPFKNEDIANLEHLIPMMATRVRILISDPDALRLLGVVEKPDDTTATILFSDISNYSSLFSHLSSTTVMELINEYFDRLCSIGIAHGGTVDKLMGDGIMFRFNIPLRLEDYSVAAVESAVRMQNEFNMLKEEWLRLGQPVKNLKHRIGIATGPVVGGMIGHPQYLSYTVMGGAVNKAAHLCDLSRNVLSGLLVCKETYLSTKTKLTGSIDFKQSSDKVLDDAYEVIH